MIEKIISKIYLKKKIFLKALEAFFNTEIQIFRILMYKLN